MKKVVKRFVKFMRKMEAKWVLLGVLSLAGAGFCLQGCSLVSFVPDPTSWLVDEIYHRRDWKHDEISTLGASIVRKDKNTYEFTLEYTYFRRDDQKTAPATLEVWYKDKSIFKRNAFVEMKLFDRGPIHRKMPVPTETTYHIKLPVVLKEGESIKIDIYTNNTMATSICKIGELNEKTPCDHKTSHKSVFGLPLDKKETTKKNGNENSNEN